MANYHRNKAELLQASEQVRDERGESQNSAQRVGQLFYDITEHIQDVSIDPRPIEDGTPIADFSINGASGTIFAPSGGSPVGPTGVQKAYFLNVTHGTTPTIPIVEEYNSSNNTFKHGNDVWLANNVNPGENQDTWMMWAWFVNNAPTSIGGATKIYDSTQGGGGGSNGKDGEEIEWIYFRSNSLIDWTSQQWAPVAEALHNYHGTSKIENTETFGGVTWYNHPQGIEANNKYEYASFRVSGYAIDGTTRVWGLTGFSDPVLWSAYGERGMDGDGVEYIFYADKNGGIEPGNNPHDWNENSGADKNGKTFPQDEYIGPAATSKWEDEPIDLSKSGLGPGSIEWTSVRKKKDGVWQKFSEPAVWSRLGEDGVVDGYTVDLSNENMPVGTDDQGHAANYSNSCLIQVFHNGTPIAWAASADSTHFSYSIGTITRSDTGGTAANISTDNPITGPTVNVIINSIGIDNFDNVNAYVPITVTLPNNAGTRKLEITLFGIAVGEAGKYIELYTSASVIRKPNDGSALTPTTLETGVKIGSGEDMHLYYSGKKEDEAYTAEEKGFTFAYKYNDNTAVSYTNDITLAKTYSSQDVTSITIQMFYDNRMIDAETIPYIIDGRDGIPGRGIDHVVSYYQATASEEPPIIDDNDVTTPQDTSWSAAVPFLWRRDKTFYTTGSPSWGDTELDGYWAPGGEGQPGKTGITFFLDPPYAIFEEAKDKTIDLTGFEATIKLIRDNTDLNVWCSLPSMTNGTAQASRSQDGKSIKVKVTALNSGSFNQDTISLYIRTPQDSPYEFYQQVKIPIYINRIGTFRREIDGEIEEAVGEITKWYPTNGNEPEKHSWLYNQTTSAIEQITLMSEDVDDLTDSVSTVSQKAEQLSSRVDDVAYTAGKNYLDYIGWEYYEWDETNYKYTEVDEPTQRIYERSSQTHPFSTQDYCSHAVYLKRNTIYVFSAYVNNPVTMQWGFCGTNPTIKGSSMGSTNWHIESLHTTDEYYQSCQRFYIFFTPTETGYYRMRTKKGQGNLVSVYRPQLEVCSTSDKTPTEWEAGGKNTSSEIKQTATDIYLDVEQRLWSTGIHIDGNSRFIELIADRTVFQNSAKTIDPNNPKIWIDPTSGTLHAVDGDFSGVVHATSGEFSGKVTASMIYTGVKKVTTNYNIDLDGDPYNAYVIWVPDSGERVCTLPSPANYIGLEIEFFAPLISRSSGGTAAISSSENIRYNDSTGFISSKNKLTMPFNKFIRLKALDINGGLAEWWVTTGDKWDSNGEPVIV